MNSTSLKLRRTGKLTLIASLCTIVSAHTMFSMESKNSSPVAYNGSQCAQGFDALRTSLGDSLQAEDLFKQMQATCEQLKTSVINATIQSMLNLYQQMSDAAHSNNAAEVSRTTTEMCEQADKLAQLVPDSEIQDQLEDIKHKSLQLLFNGMAHRELTLSTKLLKKSHSA